MQVPAFLQHCHDYSRKDVLLMFGAGNFLHTPEDLLDGYAWHILWFAHCGDSTVLAKLDVF